MLRAVLAGLIAAILTYLVVAVFVIMLSAVGLASGAELVAKASMILALVAGVTVALSRYSGRAI